MHVEWRDSLEFIRDSVFKYKKLNKLFKKFLESEYSLEAYLFIEDVQNLNNGCFITKNGINKRVIKIYNKYFTMKTEYRLNIKNSDFDKITQCIKDKKYDQLIDIYKGLMEDLKFILLTDKVMSFCQSKKYSEEIIKYRNNKNVFCRKIKKSVSFNVTNTFPKKLLKIKSMVEL